MVDTFTTTFGLDDVLSGLRGYHGLTSQSSAFIGRLHSIKIWSSGHQIAIGSSFGVFHSFYSPDETDGYALLQVEDTGTLTNPARAGFSYGMIESARIVSLGTQSKIASVQATDIPLGVGGAKLLLVVDVELDWAYATSN